MGMNLGLFNYNKAIIKKPREEREREKERVRD